MTVPPRIKPRYNRVPTAQEKAYHIWLIESFQCACGCGAVSGVVHHPLTRHPAQRWRRDHEYVVPMHGECHFALHRAGRESLFSDLNFAELAAGFRQAGIEAGKLDG